MVVIPILAAGYWKGGWAGLIFTAFLVCLVGWLYVGPPKHKQKEPVITPLDQHEYTSSKKGHRDPTRPGGRN